MGASTAAAGSSSTPSARVAPPARSGRHCPGERWADRLAEAAAQVVRTGRAALAIVPDQRDVDALYARRGPARRRRRRRRAVGGARPRRSATAVGWPALRGQARLVIGTRSAVFAPVADLGLVMVWDDGDDTLAEPRAPYPHAREVAMLRAHQLRCAGLIAGYARTAEAQALVRSGWAHDLVATRPVVRARTPRVVALDDSGYAQERDPAAHTARLPSVALAPRARALQAEAPVLVQVPRRGYVPSLACGSAGPSPGAGTCTGPMSLPDRGGRRRSAGGAAAPTPPCAARAAGRTPCAPSSSARGAPPRNWAARSRDTP